MSYIVCYAKCWACLLGSCYDPPVAHVWADDEDRAHALATNQPVPTGLCACSCAKEES